MTATATFFALIPMALGLARGSEANVPLGRAVLGGLVAGLFTTLFVVPCLYTLLVPKKLGEDEEPLPGEPGHPPDAVIVHEPERF
jgi:Cu/Ag efflux pump CusA